MSGPERPSRMRNNTHPPVSSLHHRPSPPTAQSPSSLPGPSMFHQQQQQAYAQQQQQQIQPQAFSPLAAAANANNANNASASTSTSTAVATTTAKSSRSRSSMPPTSHYQQPSGGSMSDNDASRRPGIVKQTSHDSAMRSRPTATAPQARPGSYYPATPQFPHPVPPAQYLPPSHGGATGGDKREQPRLRSSHGRSRVRFNLTDNEMQGMQTS
jgi:hypothetical protein